MMRRVVWAFLIAAALYFTVQAGEYSSVDILHQRDKKAALQAQVDSLQRKVDSLKRAERDVRTDPVTQERIARESWGMVRGSNEILYKFATPNSDSSSDDSMR